MHKKILIIFLFVFWALPALGEVTVDTAWVRRYNGYEDYSDVAGAIAVDSCGNVYVTGYSGNGTNYDYATIRYYPNGDTAWVRRYNGPGNGDDYAYAIVVYGCDNIYVTGGSYGNGTNYDYATIEYDSSGYEIWVRRYNEPGNGWDEARAIAIDSLGNVYVTGTSSGDYATIKYYPNGDTAWVRRCPGGEAYAIAVDDSGNVYVTGDRLSGGTGYDYVTIKYAPNGNELWVESYNGPENKDDFANAIAVDDSGNVYVAGWSYDSATNYDYATIRYYPNGDTAWVRKYNGPGNSEDIAGFIAVDGSDNVYVTGASYGSGTNNDYCTIKYDASGNELWVKRYNGPTNNHDVAWGIAVDGSGNVYVTGYSWSSGTNYDYTTIKYDTNGNELWVQIYNGPGNSTDNVYDIAIDGSGNVYVTGRSVGTGTSYDYATIKYVQFLRGDTNGDGVINTTDIVYLINYLFIGGPAPVPWRSGDVNSDGIMNSVDVVYLINYLFIGGPPPPC